MLGIIACVILHACAEFEAEEPCTQEYPQDSRALEAANRPVNISAPTLAANPTSTSVRLKWNDECTENGVSIPCQCGLTTSYKVQRANAFAPTIWRLSKTTELCTPGGCDIAIDYTPRMYLFRVLMTCGMYVVTSPQSNAVHLRALSPTTDIVEPEMSKVAMWDMTFSHRNSLFPPLTNEKFFWAAWRETKVDLIEVGEAKATKSDKNGQNSSVLTVFVEYLRKPELSAVLFLLEPILEERFNLKLTHIHAVAEYGHYNPSEDVTEKPSSEDDENNEPQTVRPTNAPIVEVKLAFPIQVIIAPFYALALMLAYVIAAVWYYKTVVVKKKSISSVLDVYLFASGRFCQCWIALDEMEGKPLKPYHTYWLRYHLLLWCGFFPLGFVHSDVHQKLETLRSGVRSEVTCAWQFLATWKFAFWPYGEARRLPGALERVKILLKERKELEGKKEEDKRISKKMLTAAVLRELTHPSHKGSGRNGSRSHSPTVLSLKDTASPSGSGSRTQRSSRSDTCSNIVLALERAEQEIRERESGEIVEYTPLQTGRSTTSQNSRVPAEVWGKRWTLFGCPVTGKLYWYNPETRVVLWKDEMSSVPPLNVPE